MMPQNQSRTEGEEKSFGEPRQRRPYKKPSFRFEKVLETTAFSCGKVNAPRLIYKLNRKEIMSPSEDAGGSGTPKEGEGNPKEAGALAANTAVLLE